MSSNDQEKIEMTNRSIRRGIIFAEENYTACQTWIEGTFVREFTHSPAEPLPPNGSVIILGASGSVASHVIDILVENDDINLTLFLHDKRRGRFSL